MRNDYRKILVGLLGVLALSLGLAAFAVSDATADSPVTHVVRWGDTLFSIAARYGTTVNALMQANNLRNADFIYAGQTLIIPGASVPVPPTSGTYVVQSGDTLFSIATRYGTTVNALMQANGLYNYWIFVGQTLRLPGQASPPVPQPPAPQGAYYIVRPGDYLAMIAYRYGSTVYNIQIANNLTNPSFIWVGQRLFIPGGHAPVNPPIYQPLPPLYPPLPIGVPPVYPVYPTVAPYVPPTATPAPAIPIAIYPTPTPNPNANLWEAVLITNTIGQGPCSLAAIVLGKTNWPVVVATTDGSFISDPKLTGTKPERGPYVVEFAHACTGTWRVIPLGLNIYADVTLKGGHAEVEFHPHP